MFLFNSTQNHVLQAGEQFNLPHRLYLFIYDLRKLSNQAEIKVIKVQTNILFTGELTISVMVRNQSGTRGSRSVYVFVGFTPTPISSLVIAELLAMWGFCSSKSSADHNAGVWIPNWQPFLVLLSSS